MNNDKEAARLWVRASHLLIKSRVACCANTLRHLLLYPYNQVCTHIWCFLCVRPECLVIISLYFFMCIIPTQVWFWSLCLGFFFFCWFASFELFSSLPSERGGELRRRGREVLKQIQWPRKMYVCVRVMCMKFWHLYRLHSFSLGSPMCGIHVFNIPTCWQTESFTIILPVCVKYIHV